jgi:tetratricopeptide (TPR) repeat protein
MKIILLILNLSVLISCNTKEDAKESTRLSSQSDILIKDKKLDEALTVLEKSIQLDPTNYVAYNNRAYINTERKKSSEQILADYYKALSIKPDYEISLYSIANYYFEIKNYDSTIARTNIYFDYADIYNFDKKLMQHNYAIRGESKYMLTHFDEAILDINKAIELDSLDAGAHKLLGDCYLYKNSFERAIKEYGKAIRLNNTYYQAYLGRAKSYEKLNTSNFLALAEQDYRAAFKINPDADDIYNTNSELFKQIKQVSK